MMHACPSEAKRRRGEDGRNLLLTKSQDSTEAFFVNQFGESCSDQALSARLGRLVKSSGSPGLQSKKPTLHTIREINSFRIYFDYLLESRITGQNIIKRIRLRQSGKKVLPELLSPAQIEKIYQDFSRLPLWNHGTAIARLLHQRNTVILGLMIYQGLDSGEIARLETGHANLSEGKIYIPSGRNSNSRTLKLQVNQILPIKTYLEETRQELLEKRNLQTPYLFPSKKSSDMVCKIVEAVKRIHNEIKDSRQIRASVIMNWLKTNNIRQVQYMAGHKNIRSTESYRGQDLTDLTKQLELFHPLR
jgi:integrase/recombinase XerD